MSTNTSESSKQIFDTELTQFDTEITRFYFSDKNTLIYIYKYTNT